MLLLVLRLLPKYSSEDQKRNSMSTTIIDLYGEILAEMAGDGITGEQAAAWLRETSAGKRSTMKRKLSGVELAKMRANINVHRKNVQAILGSLPMEQVRENIRNGTYLVVSSPNQPSDFVPLSIISQKMPKVAPQPDVDFLPPVGKKLVYDDLRKDVTKISETHPRVKRIVAETLDRNDCQIFMISNIIEALPDKLGLEVAPLAPAYPSMWFEYRPSLAVLTEYQKSSLQKIPVSALRYFCLVESQIKQDGGWDIIFLPGWNISGYPSFLGACRAQLKADGQLVRHEGGDIAIINIPETALATLLSQEDGPEQVSRTLAALIDPILFAMGLLNCKNIVINEFGGKKPGAGRTANRKAGSRFHVLQLHPMRKIKQYDELPETNAETDEPDARRYHLVRGHFKTYTAEAPLFGRLVGTFWWPFHATGSKEVGISDKRYQINAPDEE